MSQQSESVLNGVLIDLSRSFLQYVAESWPWVDVDEQSQSVQQHVMVVAARQRQDVGDIVSLLNSREHFIDFGTFPTEYTDLQFLSLEAMFDNLLRGQNAVCGSIDAGLSQLDSKDDAASVRLVTAIQIHQKEAAATLKELQTQLTQANA